MNNKSILSGVMITAGSTIGAGMFSIPVVSSGMWIGYSIICLLFLWALNYLSALYFLEVNTQFSPGASFNTVAKNILGDKWNFLIGIAIAFLMYILLYAYFSAFGNIAAKTLDWEIFKTNHWLQGVFSLIIGSILAFIIWISTNAVGKISTILVVGIIISFIISMSGYTFEIETANLLNTNTTNNSYFPYLWAALPYFMTSFGFTTIVPSLYKHYGKNPISIKKSLLIGSLIALFVYALFLIVCFGNISRQEFIAINKAGGNIGTLINAFELGKHSSNINFALNLFSNFAIISSFLGVGLGLFDYIADKFSLINTPKGRLKTACITFLPPGIISFLFPHGYIFAIGFAGLVAILSLCIATYFMVKKSRKSKSEKIYYVKGGNSLLMFFLLASLLVGACQILAMLNYLPKW